MGAHPNVNLAKGRFPSQGSFLNYRVRVCFHYGSESFRGVIVRDDVDDPYLTIIKLDEGRYVMATECSYTPLWRVEST